MEYVLFSFDFGIVVCLLVAMVFWLFRFVKVAYNIFKYTEIRAFYLYALRITSVSFYLILIPVYLITVLI